jgi:hypothetical protein
MEYSNILERIAPSGEAPIALAKDEPALNVTMVCEDLLTREWAAEMWDRVTQMAGKENISVTSWRISDLALPEILADAVLSAARADVIVIAVSAAEKLPVGLCVWIAAWVPRRARRAGALVALIGLPQKRDRQAFSTRDFLRMVALKSGLDFFPRERVLPMALTDPFGLETIKYQADSMAPALAGAVSGGDDDIRHWGINE